MIQLEGVYKTFRSGRGVVNALKNVSFVVEKGSTTAVVGKSGSGKSTLLNGIDGNQQTERVEVLLEKIGLADEPTASLDSETGKNFVDLMVEIGREQGCTIPLFWTFGYCKEYVICSKANPTRNIN